MKKNCGDFDNKIDAVDEANTNNTRTSYNKLYKAVNSQYRLIGIRARSIYKKFWENDTKCNICGYSRHIEVCHLKPIKDFAVDDIEVNSLYNLIGLCRNCHWELDNNYLEKEELTAFLKNKIQNKLSNIPD
jgi:5-methylcytosine-specific restriction endonuclease McrA